jgi:hypothetical protein
MAIVDTNLSLLPGHHRRYAPPLLSWAMVGILAFCTALHGFCTAFARSFAWPFARHLLCTGFFTAFSRHLHGLLHGFARLFYLVCLYLKRRLILGKNNLNNRGCSSRQPEVALILTIIIIIIRQQHVLTALCGVVAHHLPDIAATQ